MIRLIRSTLLALGTGLTSLPPAQAVGCSRVIVMPVAQAVLGPSPSTPETPVQQRLRELGAELGCRFSFPVVPRPRLQAMLLDGQADIMLPAARDAERDAVAQFLPLWRVQPELLMRRGGPRRPATLRALVDDARLQGLMVRGQPWGGTLEQALSGQIPPRLQRVGDQATLLRMLAADRADFALISPDLLQGLARVTELASLLERLELKPLPGLPATEAGIYLSRQLGETDRLLLTRLLDSPSIRQLLHAPPAPRRP